MSADRILRIFGCVFVLMNVSAHKHQSALQSRQLEVDRDNCSTLVLQGSAVEEDTHGVIDMTVGEEARQIVESTNSGGLVSMPRKMATVNLALKALSMPGDFVETGVFNGGTAVLMANVLKTRNSSRLLWAADSFAGLPKESDQELAREHHQRKNTTTIDGEEPRSSNIGTQGDFTSSRLIFENNLEANGLGNSTTNPQIKVLQGWFNETLPSAPIQQIAFLRLDGDIYVSTMDALTSLYDKVVPGGYIYVDDYGSYIGCANAVNEFRQKHGIKEHMHPISECDGCGKYEASWWQKA